MPSSSKNANGSGGQVSHRLRNFFRMNSSPNGVGEKEKNDSNTNLQLNTGNVSGGSGASSDIQGPKASRHTKFFSNTVGRLRAHTVASEGNQLEEAMSPTAHANPYFAHQGQPGLRHHNAGSVPPSPPDTPTLKISGPDGAGEKATNETKEELARRLRRIASAPNTQALFSKDAGKHPMPTNANGDRPSTAELGKDPLIEKDGSLSMLGAKSGASGNQSLDPPNASNAAAIATAAGLEPPNSLAFRRTYSSNSIKVRDVEVGPASFDKIKLIGKGDVGKVYLVREKKSSRLYAMKGRFQ